MKALREEDVLNCEYVKIRKWKKKVYKKNAGKILHTVVPNCFVVMG